MSPIYVYECPNHGRQDVFTRNFNILKVRLCQTCGRASKICVTAPSRHNIERGWNEKANEYRRDPYTQAKAQLTNLRRETLERVERDCDRPTGPIAEEAIQIGAREIDRQNREGDIDTEMKNVERYRKRLRKDKASKKATKEV